MAVTAFTAVGGIDRIRAPGFEGCRPGSSRNTTSPSLTLVMVIVVMIPVAGFMVFVFFMAITTGQQGNG